MKTTHIYVTHSHELRAILEGTYPSERQVETYREAILPISIPFEDQEKAKRLMLTKTPPCKWYGSRESCGNETCWDLGKCQHNPIASDLYPIEVEVEVKQIKEYDDLQIAEGCAINFRQVAVIVEK